MKKIFLFIFLVVASLVFNIDVHAADNVYTFSYTGNYQEWIVPVKGYYRVELWGAQGGNSSRNGGYGGYTAGTIYLKNGTPFYVYVGARSNLVNDATSFNGGTGNGRGYPGGGATDIRLVKGSWNNFESLKSRIMVAAGGGSAKEGTPGAAGGLTGYAGGGTKGGTQTSAGVRQVSTLLNSSFGQANGGCAGGGGYYGGGGSYCVDGAGGGSSFISGHKGSNAIAESSTSSKITHTGQSKHYSGYFFIDTTMIDGNGYKWTTAVGAKTLMPTLNGSGTMVGNAAAGYAKITFLYSNAIKDIKVEKAKVIPTKSADASINAYDVVINGDELETRISLSTVLKAYTVTGIGNVTLKANETHYISIVDENGNLSLYALNVIKEHSTFDIGFDEIDFTFNENTYEYNLDVDNAIKSLTPKINVGDNATYTITGSDNLRTGNNKVTVKINENGGEYTYIFNISREARVTQVFNFPYTGGAQTFKAPVTGSYEIELWGGAGNKTAYGAYTKGVIELVKDEKLYVYVGRNAGVSQATNSPDGNKLFFNAGQGTSKGWPGGGATDIRLVNGTWNSFNSLKSRIMVAGGGGTTNTGTAGAAGGLTGYSGGGTTGGTQTAVGYRIAGTLCSGSSFGQAYGGCTGGNGYYPGAGVTCANGSGGGSSFISGHEGSNAIAKTSTASSIVHTGQSIHYSGKSFTDTVMIDGKGYAWTNVKGGKELMPNYAGGYFASGVGNTGNGYARITFTAENATSTNALLESLVLTNEEGRNLIENFNAETYEYNITLNEDDDNLRLEALAQDLDARVVYEKEVFVSGSKDVVITVTAPMGDIHVYTLHLTRPLSTNPYLKGIKIDGFDLENFQSDVYNYDVELPYYADAVYVEGVSENTKQKITGGGVQVLDSIELKTELLVVSEDGTNNKLYTINFTKEKSTKLRSVTFREINKIIELEQDRYEYDLELNGNIHSLETTAISYYPGVTTTFQGNRYIGENSKKITITSSLEGVEDTIYVFNLKIINEVEKFSFDYPYTGAVQTFTAPTSNFYDVELWGGAGNKTAYGAYTKGRIYLYENQILYVYVGRVAGTSRSTNSPDANKTFFNAGTANEGGWPGAGATDVRLTKGTTWKDFDSLKSRIMVAGAGGATNTGTAGAAGGLTGYTGGGTKGGTQTSAAARQSYRYTNSSFGVADGGCTGGNGYYPGGGATCLNGSGGGSSFISGHEGSNAILEVSTSGNIKHSGKSVHYSGYTFTNTKMIDGKGYAWTNVKGKQELMPKPNGGYYSLGSGNTGNGYARIKTSDLISNDNYLDTLVITSGEDNIILNPTFEAWEKEFNVTLSKDVNKINISATPKDLSASVTGTGEIEVDPGESDREITVTAQDGSVRTYVIHINREVDNDPYPVDISVKRMITYLCRANASYCNYTFNKTTTEYTINLPYGIKEIEIVPQLKSNWQTAKYYTTYDFDNPTNNTPIETDGIFTINSEVTNIYVEVISEDGNSNVVYTYNLLRDETGNNNLESITITNPDIAITDFNPYTYEYYLTLPIGFSFDIEVVPERKPNTTVEIKNTTLTEAPYQTTVDGLVQGMNDIIITVTAENKETKTYILHVYKGFETDVLLNTLTITNGSENLNLTPAFDNRINDYSISVGSDVSSININAVARDVAGTTVTGTGAKTLKSGVNKYQVEVKSKVLNDNNEYDTNTYNITVHKDVSSNANISNITIDGYTLDPVYNKDEHEYYINLNSGESSVNVNVTMEDNNATYTVSGNNNLNKAMNEIVVTGIAEDKSYVVYKIYAYKNISTNNNLASLKYKIADDFVDVADFDKDTLSYQVNVSGDVKKIEIAATSEDKNAGIQGNGVYYLSTGSNEITIDVTSESGDIKTYTIDVIKDKNSDTSLLEVTNNRGSEVIKADDSTLGYDYLINVQYEVKTIEIKGTPNADTSVVSGNGTYNLNPGDNNIVTLRVTSEANTYKDYKIKIVRDLSNNDDLAYLYIKEGGLSPNFNRTTIYYDVVVPNNITNLSELNIEAITEDEDATYAIVDNIGELEVGVSKKIKVVVTAPNHVDTKTYTINVTRQNSTTENISLENLTTNRGELTPEFDSGILNYELTVENDITDITISATPFIEGTKIEGLGTYNLNVGKNLISVFVIGTNRVQKDYQIVVTRKKSKNATLASLVVKEHVLSPSFSSDVESYNLTTSKDYLEFTTIKTTEEEATYSIEGNTSFVTGLNIVKIVVTAPDGETKKEYILNVTKQGSNNNNLSSLSVEGYTLSPDFHKGVTFYAVDIPNNVNSIMINAKAEDSGATITGAGLKQVVTGENYFDIVVTSAQNTQKTYTILVTKDASDNNYLASLSVTDGTLNKTFDKTVNDYEVVVPNDISEIEIYGTLEDANASVSGLQKYSLNVGENNIAITVTSESGKLNVYNVKVIREEVVSAYLSNLEVKDYELDPEFNKEIFEYYVTVGNEITSLVLTTTKEDNNANVVVSGNENFVVGMNEVHINVTREIPESESLQQEYILYVNRQMSANNYLSSLIISEGVLNPEFDRDILNYKVNVPNSTSEINITATTEDSSSRITSGTGAHSLNLGVNTIPIKVRSSIGVTRTYNIEVTREESSNNKLQSIVVKDIDNNVINPTSAFDPDTYTYTYDLDTRKEFALISVVKGDEYQTVSGDGPKELNPGVNTFEIVVTAQNGSVNTYTLTINNPLDSNNNLSSLVPSVGTLDPEFNKETLNYTLNLGNDVNTLAFTATAESSKATISGNELKGVDEGTSVRNILVKAEDGTEKTYTITINKESAAEAKLSSLTIVGYELKFNPDTFSYNLQVSENKKKLLASEITATPKDSAATVNLMGDLDLVSGMINIYTIEVIAKDGYTTQTYTLNITRDSATYTLNSNVYEIVRNEDFDYVIGILPNTKISDFKLNFQNEQKMLNVYTEDGTKIMDLDTISGTGMTIKLESIEHVYDELRIIVRGDLTKDGKVNGADQVKLINYVGKATSLDHYQILAADLTKDGKVNGSDQVKLINYVGKAITEIN